MVYVVLRYGAPGHTARSISDVIICGVFSSEKLANEYITLSEDRHDNGGFFIQNWMMDA